MGAEGASFVLHSHFGGDEFASSLRVELVVALELVPLVEWLQGAPMFFTAGQAWRDSSSGVAFEAITSVLATLQQNGFCVRCRK